MARAGRPAVLLCGGDLRRPLRAVTKRALPRLSVLSVNEIAANIELSSFSVVRIDDEARDMPAIRPASTNGDAHANILQ
jgi:flagellar biosynthesis protein FlhA